MAELAASISPQRLHQLLVILPLPWEDKGVDVWEARGYFNEAQHWKSLKSLNLQRELEDQ